MPVDSLRAGMMGIGKTVFRGTAIDSFTVEILGVQRNAMRPGHHLILGRLSGAGLEETGVIRGMSGSPVYIEGRLVGAVAYGWAYAKSPLCGITPIADMLEVMGRSMAAPDEAEGWSPMDAMPAPSIEISAELLGTTPVPSGLGEAADRSVRLEPLGAPVWLAGATPGAQEILHDLFDPFGFGTIGASGGDALDESDAPGPESGHDPLVPGAALGIRFIDGDLNATAIGTLTYATEERLVGFGHALVPIGGVDMPMTGAHIYEVMPNLVASFKIGASTRPIGALRQDQFSGVAGLIGAQAQLLPVAVKVRSSTGEASYRFRLLRHADFTAALANAVLLTAMESTATVMGSVALRIESKLLLRDARYVRQSQVYGGPGAAFAAARETSLQLALLMRTPFKGLVVDSLRVDIAVGEDMATARILSARLDRPLVRAGEEVVCRVAVQPFRGDTEEYVFHLTVPADLSPGKVLVRVGSGRARAEWEEERRPDSVQPRDAAHLLDILNRQRRADELVVEISRREQTLSIDGRELPGLPLSARAALRESHSSGRLHPVLGRVVGQGRRKLPYVLSGQHTIELQVKKR